ncbi:TetR/AcrR family transcriptional regulator [Kitasatospora viridis]|uniref:TetR family transcriptional regulator n=1 Tax=Kitasatospora viridis TaxID=281105 RepID=A0A561TTR8_9ACTN|nr:helix-turn-helix domain-containing protein [Kitasatospora viridis]TWF90498.1 TetR family transcriptional regulator [Kitasatospora viridis]
MNSPRGPYRKTLAKRRQIIEAALAAYAEAGSRGVSVRDIAQRAGLTDAGVLHHFGSREALLTAALEARFASGAQDTQDGGTVRRATPGMVRLFAEVAAAAAGPDQPAHAFLQGRNREVRERAARTLAVSGEAAAEPGGAVPSPVDPAWAARILLAAKDGLQLQWLVEPELDLAGDLAALTEVLAAVLGGRGPELLATPAG